LGRRQRRSPGRGPFARDASTRRGELKTDFDPDEVDFDEIKSYRKAFPVYLRKEEKGCRAKAMSVGSDPDGGYMVTPAIRSTINGVQFETSPMRGDRQCRDDFLGRDRVPARRRRNLRRLGRRAGRSANSTGRTRLCAIV
jgi:hypothetical protein